MAAPIEPDAGSFSEDAAPAGLAPSPAVPVPLPALRPGLWTTVAVLLGIAAGAGVWAAFTGVGPAVVDGELLDESIQSRNDVLTAAAVAVTNVGGTAVMALVAVASGLWLWRTGRRADCVLAVGAMASGMIVYRGLKMLLDRPRPPLEDRLVEATSESLPSGHSTMSMIVIGTLVVLAWRGRTTTARAVLVATAALWVGSVGLTRIYLGVHWFSDVLAGWLVGAAWLALCVAVWSRWHAHRALEATAPD
jgi:membrane-associated phospholipid phosphatase